MLREISVYVVAHSRLSQEDEAVCGSLGIQGARKGKSFGPTFLSRPLSSLAIIVANLRRIGASKGRSEQNSFSEEVSIFSKFFVQN